MERKRPFAMAWRVAFWPALVVLALNVENLAQTVGFDRLLALAYHNGGPIVRWLADVLLSDWIVYAALVVVGGGLYAWSDRIAAAFQPTVWIPKDNAEIAKIMRLYADMLDEPGPLRLIIRLEHHLAQIDEVLTSHGLRGLPIVSWREPSGREHAAHFLRATYPFVKAGLFDKGADVARHIASFPRQENEPQLLPSTEGEIPQ